MSSSFENFNFLIIVTRKIEKHIERPLSKVINKVPNVVHSFLLFYSSRALEVQRGPLEAPPESILIKKDI